MHAYCRSHSIKPDAGTLHHLASFYHNTGRISEAKATFTEALKLDPHRTETACALVRRRTTVRQHAGAQMILIILAFTYWGGGGASSAVPAWLHVCSSIESGICRVHTQSHSRTHAQVALSQIRIIQTKTHTSTRHAC